MASLPASLPFPLPLIGVAVGAGAPDEGCADGPQALIDVGLLTQLTDAGIAPDWIGPVTAPRRSDGAEPLTTIASLGTTLADRTEGLGRAGRPFASLGGDHSAAIGLWSGAARAVRPERFGLIWIDAHMDAHTFVTTPSRMIHGMPVACLLGHGEPRLTGLAGDTAAVAPKNLCLIGTRSFEEGEAALLARLGVRIIAMAEVAHRGFAACLGEAIAIAGYGTARFGVSLDIDAFDPAEVTGTGLHVPDGLRPDAVLRGFQLLREPATAAKLAGLELAEYNPHNDHDGATARLIGDLIAAAFTPR